MKISFEKYCIEGFVFTQNSHIAIGDYHFFVGKRPIEVDQPFSRKLDKRNEVELHTNVYNSYGVYRMLC